MELTLTRTTKRKGCTLGVLAVDGKEMCDTMEPTWRDLKKERKVKGCTAIPEGRYPVVITLSPKFGKWLPLLLNVKVCQKAHLLCLAQSPDFHKLGLCYYLKILYL